MQKKPVEQAVLIPEHGIQGDAHAGDWHRRVSLQGDGDIQTMRGKGVEIHFGDFVENITPRGVDLAALPIGTRVHLGEVLLEVTQCAPGC